MIEEHELKDIPYGIADFRDFRIKNLYYIDKTRFIRNIEKKGSFLFFIRPRRFGKSLFLSMLEYYYDIDRKDQFDFLFNGADIQRNPTKEKNKYLVLSFNFSAVAPDKSNLGEFFLQHIRDSIGYFLDKYGKYLDIDIREAQKKFESSKGASALMGTFLNYFRGKEYKLYVIIDEYDNFANTILSDSGEEEYRAITQGEGFLRSFFNVIKAGTTGSDTPISRLFMTGVSPITLDDVTSGFNIGTNISLDLDIDEILGFTASEVETIIEYYRQTGKIRHSTPELMDIMNQWYNHYKFALRSTSEVFNTVLVLYFLREYLKESRIPDQLIDNNARIDYMKLRYLIISDKKGTPASQTNGNFFKLRYIIETGSVHSKIAASFPVEELTDPTNFISLLYYFGLLTVRGIDDEDTPVLAIPNETIKRLYYDYFRATYNETGTLILDTDTYDKLLNGMAYKGNWQAFIDYIAQKMEASLSLRDLLNSEKAHQVFWNVYAGLSTLYNVYSEKEMNQGFCDLVLEPLLANRPGMKYSYLIELKYIRPSDFEKEDATERIQALRLEAESQLNRYSLDEKFRKSIGQTTLKKLVLIFSGNRMVHHSEI
ncbi:MAG: hypothetical protein QG657_2825 [Acidobacteriota bacterium]|nr:hypothetical protein [Acidobacteriota bacterium]